MANKQQMVVSAVIAGATEENVIVPLFSYRMMAEKEIVTE